MIELAMATGTPPRTWWDEDDAVIVTALDVLDQRSRRR